jgi:hypothetical protein
MDKNLDFPQKTYNTTGYTMATFAGLFIIGTIVYFVVMAKKSVVEETKPLLESVSLLS